MQFYLQICAVVTYGMKTVRDSKCVVTTLVILYSSPPGFLASWWEEGQHSSGYRCDRRMAAGTVPDVLGNDEQLGIIQFHAEKDPRLARSTDRRHGSQPVSSGAVSRHRDIRRGRCNLGDYVLRDDM